MPRRLALVRDRAVDLESKSLLMELPFTRSSLVKSLPIHESPSMPEGSFITRPAWGR